MHQRAMVYTHHEQQTDVQTDLHAWFPTVFETYYKRIYNYIHYRVGCSYTTEDLTSHVFEKVIQHWESYVPDKAPLDVWLLAIARNTVHDHHRKQARLRWFSLDGIKERMSSKKGPEHLVIEQEWSDDLQRALHTLQERERHIIALKFGAELKHAGIARIVGVREEHVGVLLYRAMNKLRKALGSVEHK